MNEVKVVSREILLDGIRLGTVIEVAVPKKAKRLSFPGGTEGENSYLHFTHHVKGGMMNFHIRSNDELQGQAIRAHAQVVMKTMNDGREFVYVDLFPVDEPLTHWWHILGSNQEPQSDWTAYGTESIMVAFTRVGDNRLPKDRSVVSYADTAQNNSPFAALAGLK